MRASLDTNVIIHFYKANLQDILFKFFDDGVFIYEQIRDVELENHGQDVLDQVDSDIAAGKIELYTNYKLRELQVYKIFEHNVNENKNLYGTGDLGEVYAISLAQTIGAYSLVTDDTKQGGPYMSLLQFEDDIMPFTFADVLILRYLVGTVDENQ
ncbi:MAG: PIN domain-containing protein, partial [Lachnospiraceae bacterium]|nr:PIN domain-containing protein [Lachnospiraceae bacterium]